MPVPPMDIETMQQYRVEPEPFWAIAQMRGDDGYDRRDRASSHRWHAVSAWGHDGWDLGSWPLVMVFHRDIKDAYGLIENTEGDATCYQFPTAELRDAATDSIAFFHWKHAGESWVDGIDDAAAMPAHLRGAYSPERVITEAAIARASGADDVAAAGYDRGPRDQRRAR